MRKLTFLLFGLLTTFAAAGQNPVPATPYADRQKGYETRKQLEANSIVNEIEFKSIGPTIFSGRVVDLDVRPDDPSHFYVAYASGGLWKTVNNGISFTPLFDKEMVMTIGDIAVDWKRNTIWIGTGEVNSSRSSYAGTGMYKSADGGKTWQHLGLEETHHIGRVVLHPTDPNTVWVAALGHLYSPNADRGVFKTTDGGKTWHKTLFVNDNSGAVDLVVDPANPKILYAATWERQRRAWDFIESGTGTGIYKSTNGGETWTLLTGGNNDFYAGEGAGRIGLDLVKVKGKTVLYAALDNFSRRPKADDVPADHLTKIQLQEMDKDSFLNLKTYQIAEYLQRNRFPRQYNAQKVKNMIKSGEISPKTLVEYTENPNTPQFETEVVALEVYRSDDEGKSWRKTHTEYDDLVYNTIGYYFGQIRVAAHDVNKVYVLGVPVARSDDGGKTFKPIGGDNVHSDHHALWVNPNRPGHLILGNDGGVNISYDDGENWIKCNTPAVGQFYYIAVDMAKPFNVYGGLQDNGVWFGPSTYEANTNWHDTGQYPYKGIYGGDGMQVAVDTRDNTTVYTGSQFGSYARLNTKTGQRTAITPRHKIGERPLRWNWQTPIHLSTHNQDILYMGSNKLHRSLNKGDLFEEISADLTAGGKFGDVPYGTLTTIHESPLQFGLLYTGSDDGMVHVSQNAGGTWTKINPGLPQNLWISRIQASAHEKSRVYVSLNGYRWDDFSAYLFVSENFGATWKRIGNNLPAEPVNVVKEDPENADILYVGTDHGVYVSIDRGASFMQLNKGIPATPVHDLVIHSRDKKLVAGTHGRSLFLAGVAELQQLKPALLEKPLVLFDIEKTRYNSRWGNPFFGGRIITPSVKIPFYAKEAGKVELSVKNASGLAMVSTQIDAVKGLNFFEYDLSFHEQVLNDFNKSLNEKRKDDERPINLEKAKNGKLYLYTGTYTLQLAKDGNEVQGKLVVE